MMEYCWGPTNKYAFYISTVTDHRSRIGRQQMTKEPPRSRAVFSTEDFSLLKEAVGAYVRNIADDPRSSKFSNLYHRLGRLG